MFRSLGVLNYRLWFLGALVSNIGAWMQRTAQDWIVLTELSDHDASAVGIATALQFGPTLLLGPFAGVLVDRFRIRRILFLTQGAQGLLGFGLGAIVLSGAAELWMVYAFALALGVVTALDAPARQTFVSELVQTADLPNAVALNSASFNTARLIGPAVAGVLVAVIGSGWVFVINGVTTAAMLAALWALRADRMQPARKSPRGKGLLRAGFRYLGGRPDIRAVMLVLAIVGALGLNFPIFTSVMASSVFDEGASGFGLLSSAIAVGSLTGALLSARRTRPRLRVVLAAAAALGATLAIAGLMPTFTLFAIALVPVGFFTLTMLTTANAYVQTTTSPAFRGRVLSVYMMILMGSSPIGAPLVGAVTNVFGARWSIALGAAACVIAAAVGLVWLGRRAGASIAWDRDRRWRLAVRMTGEQDAHALATSELAVAESASTRG